LLVVVCSIEPTHDIIRKKRKYGDEQEKGKGKQGK
jgi:hypothetical protein